MKKESLPLNILKRVMGTIYIPAIIYIVFYMVAHGNGLTYFGNANTWRNIILNTGAAATIAYALATQIKHGRMDFSGGAIITLGSLISVYIASNWINNAFFLLIVSIVICTVLSLLVSLLYVYGKLPIIICTIGAAIFFEALTLIVNGGKSASISSNPELNFLGRDPAYLLILVGVSALLFFVFTTYTTTGKRAQLLASNQAAAVNIGIKEKKNVIQTFLLSGVLYGIAAVVFASQAFSISPVMSVLGTVAVAFSSLMPVFMGFYIGRFSKDAFGILFSSLAVGILNFGIDVVAPANYAGSFKNMIMGIFMILFFLASQKGVLVIQWVKAKMKENAIKAA